MKINELVPGKLYVAYLIQHDKSAWSDVKQLLDIKIYLDVVEKNSDDIHHALLVGGIAESVDVVYTSRFMFIEYGPEEDLCMVLTGDRTGLVFIPEYTNELYHADITYEFDELSAL